MKEVEDFIKDFRVFHFFLLFFLFRFYYYFHLFHLFYRRQSQRCTDRLDGYHITKSVLSERMAHLHTHIRLRAGISSQTGVSHSHLLEFWV
jgi:hypothetical protein